MNLLDSMMEDFVLMEKSRVNDGEGGWVTTWKDGITFRAALTMDTTMQARIAQADGMKSVYTVTTSRGVTLEFHDVIRRASDGKTFRITSDSADKRTPAFASLDIAQASAERWDLT